MTNEIKEKLLKDLKKYKKEDGTMAYDEYGTDLGIYDWGRIITILEAKLQQHEETSKAKDEEFIKLLDEIKNKIDDRINELTENCYQKQKGICVQCDAIEFELKNWINTIEEIKQRIKEE